MEHTNSNFVSGHQPPRQRTIDMFVGLAMALVAGAVGLAVHLQLDVSVSRAVISGALLFAVLITAHFMIVPRVKETSLAAELEDEELWRALQENRRDGPDTKRIQMATRTKPEQPKPAKTTLAEKAGAMAAKFSRRKPRILKKSPDNNDNSIDLSAARDLVAAEHRGERPNPAKATSASPKSSASDQEKTETPAAAAQPLSDHLSNASADAHSAKALRESDVELVQSMIKKLAHQVNRTEQFNKALPASAAEVGDLEGNIHAASTSFATNNVDTTQDVGVTEDIGPTEFEPEKKRVLLASTARAAGPPPLPSSSQAEPANPPVDALRSTASAMRAADQAAPDTPQFDQPLRPAIHADGAINADALRHALEASNYGVLLEPIVRLDSTTAAHFEIHLQINSEAAGALSEDGAETLFQATDILPEIDRQRFLKLVNVAELLRERGKTGRVFSRIYRESLIDRDFCFSVATNGVAYEALAKTLVLTLTQDAVRGLTATEWQTLSEFRELGYHFALSHVRDFEMDFEHLSAVGFGFIKLDAELFLGTGAYQREHLTSQDLARYFTSVGLSVVIENVNTAELAANVVAGGAVLGQGQVAGGPRLMKSDAVTHSGHAVA